MINGKLIAAVTRRIIAGLMNDGTVVPSSVLFHFALELDPLARHPHVIAMDIVELMHALERLESRSARARGGGTRRDAAGVAASARTVRDARREPIRPRLVRD